MVLWAYAMWTRLSNAGSLIAVQGLKPKDIPGPDVRPSLGGNGVAAELARGMSIATRNFRASGIQRLKPLHDTSVDDTDSFLAALGEAECDVPVAPSNSGLSTPGFT